MTGKFLFSIAAGLLGKLIVSGQNQTPFATIAPGEAASMDIPNTAFGVRAVVLTDSPKARVNV